jgi:hypothetical protein
MWTRQLKFTKTVWTTVYGSKSDLYSALWPSCGDSFIPQVLPFFNLETKTDPVIDTLVCKITNDNGHCPTQWANLLIFPF